MKKISFNSIRVVVLSTLLMITVSGCILLALDNMLNGQGSNFSEDSYVSLNSEDSEFIKIVDDDNNIINVFGERDTDGFPVKIQQIIITTPIDGEYNFFMDDNGEIEKVVADNGTIFYYDWVSDEKVAIGIECNDGESQLNTEITQDDLDEYSQKSILTDKYDFKNYRTIRDCSELEFEPFESDYGELKSTTNTQGNVYYLNVAECSVPSWIRPSRIYLYDQSGSVLLKELSPVMISKGRYSITIPGNSAPSIDPQKAAEVLEGLLSRYCDAEGLASTAFTAEACAIIAAKLASTGIGTSVAPGVGVACAGVIATLKVYCATLGKSVGQEAPSLTKKILEMKPLEGFKVVSNMRLHVHFPGIPNNIVKAFNVIEGGAGSTFYAELNSDGDPKIKYLTLSPSSPSEGQGYSVSTSVYCANINSVVQISVIGTDGYTQNESYTITSVDQTSGKFTTSVPGADSGVRDEVTVTLTSPGKGTITKKASLVFGK